MSHLNRSITGLSATLLLLSSLIGCGQYGSPAMPAGSRPGAARPVAKRPAPARVMPGGAVRSVPVSAMNDDMEAEGEAAAPAPAPAAPAAGALRPLPKATPTPGPGKESAGAEPDDVDRLYGELKRLSYRGTRGQMVDAVHAVTTQYPLGWDPRVEQNLAQHYDWWKQSQEFASAVPSLESYHDTAIKVAQNMFDVRYYVWTSKQAPAALPGQAPEINLSRGFSIVKGMEDRGFFVEISPQGLITDFLYIPHLENYNHLIPIDPMLY